MRRILLFASASILFAASLPSLGEEPVVSLGKQRAARSAVEWDVQDIEHAQLGPIKFAVQKRAVAAAVPNDKVLSLSFVSCQKSSGKVAIELTNAPESDPAGGLRPTELPRLVCSSPGPKGGLVKKDLAAKWEISSLGDTLARGLAASELRRCVSIDILQSVALPRGATPPNRRISLEITPYHRALDAVFVACGEKSAFAPAEPVPSAAAPVPESAPAAPPAGAPWKPARTTTKGRTNVRASASTDAAIVTKLAPGSRVLVRQASASWWEVKPRSGTAFRGYVREDRFAFE